MEKQQFVATEPDAWWLVARDLEYRIEAGRRALGEALGWGDPLWYTEAVKLEELYRRLETSDYHLLIDLDLLAYDDQRVEWVTAATTAVSPVASPEPERPASSASPPPAAVAPKPKLFTTRSTEKNVELHGAVQEVLTELTGDRGAELAGELGLTAEEAADLAHDPDFERMVAEEAAKLAAQRAG